MSGVTLGGKPEEKELQQLRTAMSGRGTLNTKPEEKDPNSPATTSHAYDEMLPAWAKIDTLLAGTEAMRAAAERYLPKHAEESNAVYNERLAAATLFNMLEKTLDSWVGRPFSDPVHIDKETPDNVREWLDDCDLRGNNIDVFAREWFRAGLAKGLSHVFVDMPRRDQDIMSTDGKPEVRTLADDRASNARPYLVHIEPHNLLFAHAETVDGREVLTQIRIKEHITEMDGFAEVVKTQIRVVYPGRGEIWERKKDNKKKEQWVMTEEYTYDLDYIPLVTFYANRKGFQLAKPPLTDLADLNIAHWQSSSDQRQILTTARFPVLALSGAGDDDNKLTIGPNHWLYCPDPQGRFYYVEHSGAAIESGRKDLLDLEEQMAQYGAEFMKKRVSGQTATARALDSAEATSPLQDAALRFTDALNTMLSMMAGWAGVENPGALTITTDFGPEEANDSDLRTLGEARKSRDISRQTYLDEMKRRGVLSDEFDAEEDAEALEQEMLTALGGTTLDLDPEQEAEDEPEEDDEGQQ